VASTRRGFTRRRLIDEGRDLRPRPAVTGRRIPSLADLAGGAGEGRPGEEHRQPGGPSRRRAGNEGAPDRAYALLQGGPLQALAARREGGGTPWHSALPELVFPSDRSWLVSTLRDDEWRCVGGPAVLVQALLARPQLEARSVATDEVVTPPGMS